MPFDLGSHLVDQALVCSAPVTHVYASSTAGAPGDAGVDDDVFVALTHASGTRSHLAASVLAAQPGARFRVVGDRAAYVKHGLDLQEPALAAGRRPGDAGWGEDPRERWGRVGVEGAEGDGAPRPVRTEPGAYEQFYAGVLASIRDGAPPPVAPADAAAGLAILEAAHASAAGGRVVRVAG
jgi:predicted dehydrogenase